MKNLTRLFIESFSLNQTSISSFENLYNLKQVILSYSLINDHIFHGLSQAVNINQIKFHESRFDCTGSGIDSSPAGEI